MEGFTHLDARGQAAMVDVGGKDCTHRVAVAAGRILLSEACYRALREGTVPKGDVLSVARVAGIMAAKKTGELIPLCHPLALTRVGIEFAWLEAERALEAVCTAECTGQTGVEMEALTGAGTALLTVYDMCKALDKGMTITDLRLLEKRGGKSGDYRREANHA